MKKTLLLFSCLLCAISIVEAQAPEQAQAVVHYKFSHLRDTTKKTEFYNENMVLFLGKNSSAYKSYDKKMADALMKKQVQEQMAANPGGNIKIMRGKNSGSNTEYYQFPNEKRLVRKEKLFNSYLIDEAYPVIDWKISADTASFAGLQCQKAITHFKGRDYTAWFCPDLPFHSGPWKLNGLPGVILEAYDDKKEVVFKFDGIEDLTKAPKASAAVNNDSQPTGGVMIKMIGMDDDDTDPNIIQLPSGGIKTTEKEFTNLKDAMKKDPNAFAQSAMAGSGANLQGGPGPKPSINIKIGAGPVINNPIELPEKK
ncbi:GLPGLI family protein [Mucilaginibacter sp. BJC16-A38]|uniref:GLPGLI family protein n=1 Tax=Mucilaginibacter phenanthrenivorans TaxID=1234842 RepID=UPI0021589F24|nr:GLPGLI family protein [Mucilaginibacter phenanthrenivorans]MCR8558903.1 GLPGLI family protein [Mucilaginibacter phenanthrenivorans]